jgi:Tol biopolymer transport system component
VDNTEPALSHDGSRIVFRSERGDGGLFAMEATGENPQKIAQRGHLDGRSIVFCDGTFIMPNDRGATISRLHVLDIGTNIQRELDTGDAVQPNWSPHGQRIAYWGITEGGNRRITKCTSCRSARTDGDSISVERSAMHIFGWARWLHNASTQLTSHWKRSKGCSEGQELLLNGTSRVIPNRRLFPGWMT